MLNEFWSAFKSGTDIRGVATAGAGYEVNLTDEVVEAIVNGFVLWLCKKTGKTAPELIVSVGRDSRISGPRMAKVTKATLLKAGVCVIDCGLASTPAMFMTTVELSCDGAVQITASHHPYYRNGLKFFTREGGLEGEHITAILTYAQDSAKPEPNENGRLIENDYMTYYAGLLREMIKEGVRSKEDYHHPLKGFRIVVDAGNGVGGFYAANVLELLGADVRGSQFLEPDGMFPNHIPNPEDAAAMASVSAAVKANHADLGVIFDTDVDRCGAVGADGQEINRNRLVALAAVIALEGNEGGMIVTDSITSSGLHTFIEKELGGQHLRFKRGYKNVIDEAIRQNENGVDCPLAIETSGHAAMRENYFLDDGAYLMTKIIIKAAQLRREGKTLDSVIANLKEPVERKEIRIKITTKDFRTYGEKVIADLTKYAKTQKDFMIANDNHEGIRVSFDGKNGDGWFLLRLSVHDPIMPLNIESDTEGGVEKIYQKIKPFLEDCEFLDTYVKKAAPKAPAKKAASAAKKAEEKKTAAPAVKANEKKAEAPAVKADEKKAEAPAVKADEKKAEAPAVKADEKKAEAPAVKADEKKAETPAVKAEEKKAEAPAVKEADDKQATALAVLEEQQKGLLLSAKANESNAAAPAVEADEKKAEDKKSDEKKSATPKPAAKTTGRKTGAKKKSKK